jgi:putative spermidine/putrescine transport system substrate-binding protein
LLGADARLPRRRLAHAWIDLQLDELAARLLVERQGLANTLRVAEGSQGRLVWLEPVEDAARRERLWAGIRAGRRRFEQLEVRRMKLEPAPGASAW